MPDWEIRDAAVKLEKHTKVIENLLNQLKPEEWVKQGAPALYIDQLKQAKQYNSYITLSAQALERDPARLSYALDVFLRLEHMHSLLESLDGGVRAHQNPALADLLAAAIGENAATRERLKEYTLQLAVEREKEWEIADREAQRCRGMLAARPPAPVRKPAPAKQ